MNFACCMAQKCLWDIFRLNSASVIGNANKCIAAVLNFDGYAVGTCIYGVFDKFFYNRTGSVNNFSCGNKFRNMFIEKIYFRHFFTTQFLFYNAFKFIKKVKSLNGGKRFNVGLADNSFGIACY